MVRTLDFGVAGYPLLRNELPPPSPLRPTETYGTVVMVAISWRASPTRMCLGPKTRSIHQARV